MGERCKICQGEFNSGIWIAPQFKDEKVLLFCSEKCKNKYVDMKLQRIKSSYPRFYDKIINSLKEGKKDKAIDQELWDMVKGSGV